MSNMTDLHKYYMRFKRKLHPYERPSTSTATVSQIIVDNYENVETDIQRVMTNSPVNVLGEEPPVDTVGDLDEEQRESTCSGEIDYHDKVNSGDTNTFNFQSDLVQWALKNNISHVALKELLLILKTNTSENFPLDPRTILHTIRSLNLKSITPGNYYHFGIKNCIQKLVKCSPELLSNSEIIELKINIDGLPLSKSSTSQVYPILCCLNGSKLVEIIGMYHGYQKPSDANQLLSDFVSDAVDLVQNGVLLDNKKFKLVIKCIICDAPAKSFVKLIKGHSGYSSCTKCSTEGQYIDNKVCFPEIENLHLRTNEEYRLKIDDSHHLGTSLIENIPNFDMIHDFPLDYMHLICLGIMKKLLSLWCLGKPSTKISFQKISTISNSLELLLPNIPQEFNRKPRSLNDLKRWKATEFRLFLFYAGPVVLLGNISKDRYINFLTLHIICTIFSNRNYFSFLDYASDLSKFFVKCFKILYGPENISHNVHNILHLANDVRKHGTLDDFSAFPFENFLQSILKLVRKSDKPLQQIIKRHLEYSEIKTQYKSKLTYPFCRGEINSNVLLNNFICSKQYSAALFKDFVLKCSEPDNCCCLKNGDVIIVRHLVLSNEQLFIVGNRYLATTNFYTNPCESSDFGIFLVQDCNLGPLEPINLTDVLFKYVKLKMNNFDSVIFPLLHCNMQ